MRLFTRIAISIFISTTVPILLLYLTVSGRVSFQTDMIVILTTGLIMMIWIYSSIVRPLEALRKATQNIKEGNLDFTLDVETDDEIGELTADFEEMRIRLKESQEEKLISDRESKELISNIAHDLKTPITTIRGYAEGILDGVAATPEMQDKYVRTIYNKSVEMTGLIEELTFYAKIDTNRIPYNFIRLKVRDYFDDCADEIRLDVEGKGIRFDYNCSVGPEELVIADPEQLHKVINNIVGNSVKYMNRDIKIITMNISDIGDFIQCDLSDTGKGVAKKDLTLIFERFYRTDASRNSSQGGSGIGLSIVKKIVEDHGGRIWASCEEGEGLTIHFILRKYVSPVGEQES